MVLEEYDPMVFMCGVEVSVSFEYGGLQHVECEEDSLKIGGFPGMSGEDFYG